MTESDFKEQTALEGKELFRHKIIMARDDLGDTMVSAFNHLAADPLSAFFALTMSKLPRAIKDSMYIPLEKAITQYARVNSLDEYSMAKVNYICDFCRQKSKDYISRHAPMHYKRNKRMVACKKSRRSA